MVSFYLFEVKKIINRRFRMGPGWLLRYARGFHPWSGCHLIVVWSGFSLRFHVATDQGAQSLQQTRGLEDKNIRHASKASQRRDRLVSKECPGSLRRGVEHLIAVWLASFTGCYRHRPGCITSLSWEFAKSQRNAS